MLFYGNVSPRLLTVLDAIARAGIDLQVVSGVYRRERDALIARARIVLNVHATETAALEIARVAHVLSNRRALVSELGPNAKIDPDLRDGIAAGVAWELPGLCRALLADDRRRLALAGRGFELFSRRDFSASLREVLGARDASRSRSLAVVSTPAADRPAGRSRTPRAAPAARLPAQAPVATRSEQKSI